MGDIAKQRLAMTSSLCVFGGSVFAPPFPDIPNKHNIKETASKGNTRSRFYMPEGGVLDGSLKNKKIIMP